jgi:serine/threonine protein kinase
MSAPIEMDSGPSGEDEALVQILDRFEDAWERGLAPRLEDYLPTTGVNRTVLVGLVHIDLERRLKAAESVRVESYLQRFPVLKAEMSTLLELIEAEFTFRHRVEPTLDPEEYVSRFPQLEHELRQRLSSELPTDAGLPSGRGGEPVQVPPGYEALDVLGRGGMGIVLLARNIQTGEKVAIKVLRSELRDTPQAVRMFHREAKHMARLEHPNILPVLQRSSSSNPDTAWYAMPYLPRGSLMERLSAKKPLDRETILRIVRQVADALRFAHEHGIIHRDLKPANILLDEEGKAYLSDFGLLRTLYNDSVLDVRRPQCLGTAPYMSPRTAAGQAEDVRCDIYAFGAVLYELLTGRPPYFGNDVEAVVNQILSGPPEPIGRLNPRADPGLARIAEGAMARALRDRYAVMEDVIADLDRVAAGQEPVGPGTRTEKPRHGLQIVAFTALAVAAVSMLAAAFLLMQQANRPLSVQSLDVEVLSGDPPRSMGRLGDGLSAARPEDQVRIRGRLSRKAYCYLIALNTDGSSNFCPKSANIEPPEVVREIVYPPPGSRGFRLGDSSGMQGFVLAASLRPLKPFITWEVTVNGLPWKPGPLTEGWTYDGRDYWALDERLRGQESNLTVSAEFKAVCSFLRKRKEFDVVQAIAFPVKQQPAEDGPPR